MVKPKISREVLKQTAETINLKILPKIRQNLPKCCRKFIIIIVCNKIALESIAVDFYGQFTLFFLNHTISNNIPVRVSRLLLCKHIAVP